MALTRANVETILIRRVGRLLSAAGLDGTTVAGTNADLNDPIGYALRTLSYAVSNPALVAEVEVGACAAEDHDALLDVAEVRALETIAGNLDTVDLSVGQRSERFGQLLDHVRTLLKEKREQVADTYGFGAVELSAGSVGLGMQAEADEETF